MTNTITNINNYKIGGNNFDGPWKYFNENKTIIHDTWLGTGWYTYDLRNILPQDTFDYEVLITGWFFHNDIDRTGSILLYSGQNQELMCHGVRMGAQIRRSRGTSSPAGITILPIFRKSPYLTVYLPNNGFNCHIHIAAYRRLSPQKISEDSQNISTFNLPNGDVIKIGGDTFDGNFISTPLYVVAGWTTFLACGATVEYDVSSYLPNDTKTYEVLVSGCINTVADRTSELGFILPGGNTILWLREHSQHSVDRRGCTTILVGPDRKITLYDYADAEVRYSLNLHGYRRVAKNDLENIDYIGNLQLDGNNYSLIGNFHDTPWQLLTNACTLFNTTFSAGSTTVFSLENIIPNDGYDYMILCTGWTWCYGNNSAYFRFASGTKTKEQMQNFDTDVREWISTNSFAQHSTCSASNWYIPIRANDKHITILSDQNSDSTGMEICGYRRIGTNQ